MLFAMAVSGTALWAAPYFVSHQGGLWSAPSTWEKAALPKPPIDLRMSHTSGNLEVDAKVDVANISVWGKPQNIHILEGSQLTLSLGGFNMQKVNTCVSGAGLFKCQSNTLVGYGGDGGTLFFVSNAQFDKILFNNNRKLIKNLTVSMNQPIDRVFKTTEGKDGKYNSLSIVGVSEIYKVGGAQAIAAMGVGTQTIKPVDKLFGPGNAFVIEAKRRLFGSTGVDLLPGPSEVLVMADSSSNPRFVVADLLSQAEHGSGREKIFLVSTSKKLVEKVRESLPDAAAKLSRTQMLMKIIADGCIAIIVPNLDAACEVANFISPEHMELMTDSPEKLVPKIKTAGAILVGEYTPTVLGDFTAGPSHTLPTGRTGRFSGGLQLVDFMRRSSYVKYDKKSVQKAMGVVGAFASMEGLDAHGSSLTQRIW